MTNNEALQRLAPMCLNGFPRDPPYGGLAFHVAGNDSIQALFDAFRTRVIAAVGRKFLPVYRMADGEFQFLVGFRCPAQHVGASALRRASWRMREIAARLGSRGIETCWGERYKGSDAIIAHRRLSEGLKWLAERGVLAAYFARRGDQWGHEYIGDVWRWMDREGITLGTSNYVPFYFVYALLSGPGRSDLFEGRRVLVVTSLGNGREDLLRKGLGREGVTNATFLPLSSTAAMLEELGPLPQGRLDLALIGGGIGAINVLRQLEPLGIPAIDAGMALECIMNPNRRLERPFLSPLRMP